MLDWIWQPFFSFKITLDFSVTPWRSVSLKTTKIHTTLPSDILTDYSRKPAHFRPILSNKRCFWTAVFQIIRNNRQTWRIYQFFPSYFIYQFNVFKLSFIWQTCIPLRAGRTELPPPSVTCSTSGRSGATCDWRAGSVLWGRESSTVVCKRKCTAWHRLLLLKFHQQRQQKKIK